MFYQSVVLDNTKDELSRILPQKKPLSEEDLLRELLVVTEEKAENSDVGGYSDAHYFERVDCPSTETLQTRSSILSPTLSVQSSFHTPPAQLFSPKRLRMVSSINQTQPSRSQESSWPSMSGEELADDPYDSDHSVTDVT
uniref:Uncharacterized protein LOC114345111 n=1 Tax=Diabrotica virgifera virgifera TaxID=50390 RepID=A0A6P7GZY4_DIAVI